METQSPKCGNWVECKKVDTLTRKTTRTAVRKGSVTVASAAIAPIIPDTDTLIWVAAGFTADILMDDYLNEQVKKGESLRYNNHEGIINHLI